ENVLLPNPPQQRFGNVDFTEEAILEFTSERQGRKIKWGDIHRTRNGPNFAKLVSELRAGRAVKVRVPSGEPPLMDCQPPHCDNRRPYNNKNCYIPRGHFVLAYGIKDPSIPDLALSLSDILIADPGHGGIRTLQDYGDRGYNQFCPDWFELDKRLYLYEETQDLNQQTVDVNLSSGT